MVYDYDDDRWRVPGVDHGHLVVHGRGAHRPIRHLAIGLKKKAAGMDVGLELQGVAARAVARGTRLPARARRS